MGLDGSNKVKNECISGLLMNLLPNFVYIRITIDREYIVKNVMCYLKQFMIVSIRMHPHVPQ